MSRATWFGLKHNPRHLEGRVNAELLSAKNELFEVRLEKESIEALEQKLLKRIKRLEQEQAAFRTEKS